MRAGVLASMCLLLAGTACIVDDGGEPDVAGEARTDDPAAASFTRLLSDDPIATRASSTIQWFSGQVDTGGEVMSEDDLFVATRAVFLDTFVQNEGQPWPFPGSPSPTLFGEVDKGISALLQASCTSGAPCQFSSAKDRDLMTAQLQDVVARVERSGESPDEPFIVSMLSAGRNRVSLDRYPNQRLTKLFVIVNKASGKFAAAYVNAPAQ